MNNQSTRYIVSGLWGAVINEQSDGGSGFHIDYIDEEISARNRAEWPEKAWTLYLCAEITREQLGMAWHTALVIYLQSSQHPKASDIKLHEFTPPEICIFPNLNYKKSATSITAAPYSFLPREAEVSYAEYFDEKDREYQRLLSITLPRRSIFRLMIKAITLSTDVQLSPQQLTPDEHGAFLFIVHDDPQEAVAQLRCAIALDPSNIDAYFWLSTCLYYCLDARDEAIDVLTQAIDINASRADCHMLLYRLLWEKIGAQESAVAHARRAAELEPTWPLPRVQLAYYLYRINDTPRLIKEIEALARLAIQPQVAGNILERYKAIYSEGRSEIIAEAIGFLIRSHPAVSIPRVGF